MELASLFFVSLSFLLQGIFNVFYLDFGNEEEVPRERLRPLSAKLSSLPPFTVQLALSPANVTPDQGTGWSAEASSKFSDLILDKEVHAVITSCIRKCLVACCRLPLSDLYILCICVCMCIVWMCGIAEVSV